MNFLFSMPAALFGLLGIGVLVGIYLFRNRFRRQVVSSLMLWDDHKKPRQGGVRLSRIQTPLLFLLELLTILLLVLAAAGPLLRRQEQKVSYVMILDDSCSMQAGDPDSPRRRARQAVLDLLEQAGVFRARFILAGMTPRLLGEPVETMAEARQTLNGWACQSAVADLDEAMLLGMELAGQTERLLVITDHAPGEPLESAGKLEWRAFGRSLPNIAFVEAGYAADGRCFMAAANLSDQPAKTTWGIDSVEDGQRLHEQTLTLEPRQTRRIFLDMAGTPALIRARLEPDGLEADNEVILVRERNKVVRVDTRIENEALDEAVRRAVEASGMVDLDRSRPHLLLTDSMQSDPAAGDCWQTVFLSDPNAVSFMGPFLVDRSHPLTEGLDLKGVIWGAGRDRVPGRPPVIAAGNVPLVQVQDSAGGSQYIRIRFNPRLSTLLQSPNWPILVWNLLRWRQSFLPGLDRSNYRLGQTVSFIPSQAVADDPILVDPQGRQRPISSFDGRVQAQPETTGLYRIRDGQVDYPFAVNLLSPSESDLSGVRTGQWGQWQEASLFRWEYQALDGLFLLVALVLMTLHRWIHVRAGEES